MLLRMNADELEAMLEENGEVMVQVADIDTPLELHLHDTEVGKESVVVQLADGELKFDLADVSAAWKHYHSLADYGLN